MLHKYFDGLTQSRKDAKEEQWSGRTHQMFLETRVHWWEGDLYEAAANSLAIVRAVDGYIEETAPFKLAKDPEKLPEVGVILSNCLEALRISSLLLWPFIPDACEEFWRRIGCDYKQQMEANGGRGKLDDWVQWGQLEPGTPIEKGPPLFPRYQVK